MLHSSRRGNQDAELWTSGHQDRRAEKMTPGLNAGRVFAGKSDGTIRIFEVICGSCE